MPQGLTTPNWYNDDTYIKDKVAECNVIRFGDAEQLPWTAESVRSFLAAANGEADYQPWMGYENFVSNGNAENCSPNPLFNVMEYLTAKANQLNALDEGAGYEGSNAWTAESVLRYFNDHGITAWDHFTTAGQFEGVNPSNAMDLSEFLANKAAQCNAMKFDGKTDWTPESVLEYYRANGLNAVEVAVNANDPNVVAVSEADKVIVPENETPWGVNTIIYHDIPLVKGQDQYEGTPTNDNFVGTVGGADATLTPSTRIDGGNGQNMLTANMNGDFRGFAAADALTNIETISLANTTKAPKMFNAQNITGVETWTLDSTNAPINVSMLQETGTTVNIKGLSTAQTTSIQFAPGVADGVEADSMTIGLENIGKAPTRAGATPTYTGVSMRNIEDVTINATGKENYANLAGVTDATALTVTGGADLYVNQAGSAVRTLDATAATGDLDINLTNASVINSAELGAGDDTLQVANLATTAKVSGGEGADSLEITNATQNGRYQLDMNGLETLRVDGRSNIGDIRFSSEDTYGLENLVLAGWGNGNFNQIRMDNFNDYALNVQTRGDFNQTASAILNDVADVTLIVGGINNESETFSGRIVAGDASNVTITLNGTTNNPDDFNGYVDAPNATSITINGGADNQNVSFATTRADMIGDLSNISEIDVNGSADVDLTGVAGIGQNANSLNVNAADANGNFTANFSTATDNTNASIMVAGSQTGNNTIGISGNYSYVNVTGNVGNDTLKIAFEKLADNATINVDLGSGGNDRVLYTKNAGQDVSAWLDAIRDQNPDTEITNVGTFENGVLTFTVNDGMVGSNTIASVKNIGTAADAVFDTTSFQFAGTNNGLQFTIPSTASSGSATFRLGDTGTNGATITTGTSIPTNGIKMNLTEATSDAVIDANAAVSTGGKFIVDTAVQGSTLTIDLAENSQADIIQLKMAPTNGQSGVWNMTYVKDFDPSKDKIYSGEGAAFMDVVSGTTESFAKWLSLAGIDNFSDIQVLTDNRGFSWQDAGGTTWNSYVALNTNANGGIIGTGGMLVSLQGVELNSTQVVGGGSAAMITGVTS